MNIENNAPAVRLSWDTLKSIEWLLRYKRSPTPGRACMTCGGAVLPNRSMVTYTALDRGVIPGFAKPFVDVHFREDEKGDMKVSFKLKEGVTLRLTDEWD